jgi:hypothetical protein
MFHFLLVTLTKKNLITPKWIVEIYLSRLHEGVYLEAPFVQETLKNFLQQILKELKLSNSN